MLGSISGAEAVAPRQLVEVSDLANPTVSPDGRQVAFRVERASIERNVYDTAWYVAPLDGSAPPRRVSDGGVLLRNSAGGPLPGKVVWSADGHWIHYRALINGRIDVWRAAADGSSAEPLTLDPADVRDFVLSADGTRLVYSVGATREEVVAAEDAEYNRGIHIDGSVPVGQSLFRSGTVDGRKATQRYSGSWFDRAPLLAEAPAQWKVVDLVTLEGRPADHSEIPSDMALTGPDLRDGEDAWKFSRDPQSGRVALLTRVGDKEGQRQRPAIRLSMLSPAGKGFRLSCEAEACADKAIDSIQWRPDSDEVLFTVTDPDAGLAQSVFRWNVRTGVVRQVVASPGLVNGGRDPYSTCGASHQVLACVTAAADMPPRLERVDLETGQRLVLFDPNAALAHDMARTVSVELLRWTDAEGRRFSGQLYRSRDGRGRPAPLFVTYYTCPGFVRGGFGDEWPLASLARHGIAALCINRQPHYLNDAVERFGEGLAAVESVVKRLASKGWVDASKVGMGGLSFGSEVALWTATESDLLAAVSVSSPAITPNYYLFGSLKGDAFLEGLDASWQLGAPQETPERWSVISPAFNVDRISAPVLFQMSEQEYLHALDYAVPLILGRRADLYVFPDEPHQKFQPRHKLSVYDRNLDWFRFWLQGYEDPAPGKASQYAHWRAMRSSLPEESVALWQRPRTAERLLGAGGGLGSIEISSRSCGAPRSGRTLRLAQAR